MVKKKIEICQKCRKPGKTIKNAKKPVKNRQNYRKIVKNVKKPFENRLKYLKKRQKC